MDSDLKKLEEKYSKDKPTFSLIELVKCSALVVVGCFLLFAMPDEMGIIGWILFAIGTFLNVVGIFRLAAMIPEAKNDQGGKIATVLTLVIAAFVQVLGLCYLYNSDGTGKGIAITTLAICVSLGLIIHVVDFDDENNKKMIRTACKVITVLFAAIATFLIVRNDFATVSIYVGTILYIEAAVAGKIGFTSNK